MHFNILSMRNFEKNIYKMTEERQIFCFKVVCVEERESKDLQFSKSVTPTPDKILEQSMETPISKHCENNVFINMSWIYQVLQNYPDRISLIWKLFK